MNDTIKIGATTPTLNEGAQSAENISFSSSKPTSSVSNLAGINILRKEETFDSAMTYLKKCGINIQTIVYSKVSMTESTVLFFVCKTIHGNLVIVKAPSRMQTMGGDIEVGKARPGINFIPTHVVERFEKFENRLKTDYVFICNGGMKYVSRDPADREIYAYIDYDVARRIFGLRKYRYEVVPAVQYERLVEVNRINTLEIGLELSSDEYSIFAEAIRSVGFGTMLSSEGPFTILTLSQKDASSLQSKGMLLDSNTIGSHILIGRHEYTIPYSPGEEIEQKRQASSYTGSVVELIYIEGILEKIKTRYLPNEENVEVSVVKQVFSKWNGLMLEIDGPLPTHLNEDELELPEVSDLFEVVTILDIEKHALLIHQIRYMMDIQEQQKILKTTDNIRNKMDEVLSKMYCKMNTYNAKYIENLQSLIDQTYMKEVPCLEPTCEIYSATEEKVLGSYGNFKRTVDTSLEFSSLLIDLEHVLLRILSIEQEIDMEKIIKKPENYDLSDDE